MLSCNRRPPPAAWELAVTLSSSRSSFATRRRDSRAVVARAGAGDTIGGAEPAGDRDDNKNQQEGGHDAVSRSLWKHEDAAEKMELRDFRARLLSKGLDGWGVEGGGEVDGGGQQQEDC